MIVAAMSYNGVKYVGKSNHNLYYSPRTHLPLDWLPESKAHVTYLFLYPADPDFILSLYSHFRTSSALGFKDGDWDTFFRLWTSEKGEIDLIE
jgi:hypothetical protein